MSPLKIAAVVMLGLQGVGCTAGQPPQPAPAPAGYVTVDVVGAEGTKIGEVPPGRAGEVILRGRWSEFNRGDDWRPAAGTVQVIYRSLADGRELDRVTFTGQPLTTPGTGVAVWARAMDPGMRTDNRVHHDDPLRGCVWPGSGEKCSR